MKNVLLKTRFRWSELHSLYQDLIKNPPENYRVEKLSTQTSNLKKILPKKSSNYFFKKLFHHLGPIPFTMSLALESPVKYENYDLIFATQHIIKTEQPWIVDFEYANALASYFDMSLCKNIISKRLKSQSCKAILPWSNWAANTLRSSINCKHFNDKLRVVRYTVPSKKKLQKKENKSKIRILFVGTTNPANMYNFEFKGLYETVDAFIDLQKQYDHIELVIRSVVSSDIREKAKKFSNIKIIEKPLSQTDLEELYQSSDIFPHSGFEVLNLSILEAMSYGLPVISTSLYSTPELIKNMKNGILIDPPDPEVFYTKNKIPNEFSKSYFYSVRKFRQYMTEKLKENMKLLIEDSSLRNKIGKEASLTIEEGEFSMKHRKNLLKEIFDCATKN